MPRELNRGQESFRNQGIVAPPSSDEEKSPDPFLTDWAHDTHTCSHRVKTGSGLFLATHTEVPTAPVSKKDSRPRFYAPILNRQQRGWLG